MKRIALVLLCSAAIAAFAAGGGGGGGGGGGSEAAALVPDADYQAAMAAVGRKDWKQVIVRMGAYARRNPDNADAWNELGHAHRLTGDLKTALDDYGKALKIDPRHRGAHEYLGEAYLQLGDLPRAEQELKTLDKLCFFRCEEYSDLKEQIEDYRKTRSAKTGS
jgi:tetratricopeptide (TPR) repeat protein